MEEKNVITATRSEVTSSTSGAIEVEDEQIVSLTLALSLEKVPGKMVVIGGRIIEHGLEIGSVWNRLGSYVTIAEFLDTVRGAVIDEEISYAPLYFNVLAINPYWHSESNSEYC